MNTAMINKPSFKIDYFKIGEAIRIYENRNEEKK